MLLETVNRAVNHISFSRAAVTWRLVGASVLAAGALSFAGLPEANSQGASLEGSWSGGGQIVFPSGEKEQARCRANFRRQGGDSFDMSATCATASAKVQQSAAVTRVSGDRYRGEFHNTEFGITGSIRITISGNRLNASLNGGGGSAEFSLSR